MLTTDNFSGNDKINKLIQLIQRYLPGGITRNSVSLSSSTSFDVSLLHRLVEKNRTMEEDNYK